MPRRKKENVNLFRSSPVEDNLDRTPVAIPVGARAPKPLQQLIAECVRQQVHLETGDEFGSLEEEDDFEPDPDVEGDLPSFSKYTLDQLQPIEGSMELEPEPEKPSREKVRDLLDRTYGPGNYPESLLGDSPTGDRPNQNAEEPSEAPPGTNP